MLSTSLSSNSTRFHYRFLIIKVGCHVRGGLFVWLSGHRFIISSQGIRRVAVNCFGIVTEVSLRQFRNVHDPIVSKECLGFRRLIKVVCHVRGGLFVWLSGHRFIYQLVE